VPVAATKRFASDEPESLTVCPVDVDIILSVPPFALTDPERTSKLFPSAYTPEGSVSVPAVTVVVPEVVEFVSRYVHAPPVPENVVFQNAEVPVRMFFPLAVAMNSTVPPLATNAPPELFQLPPTKSVPVGRVRVPPEIVRSFDVVETPGILHAPPAPLKVRL
jgi:hypothetical protein